MLLVYISLLLSLLAVQGDAPTSSEDSASILDNVPFHTRGRGLQCFSCVGSSDQECNRQGSIQCPRDSDACTSIRGQSSGVMKSCSFKSFCDRALQDGSKTPGVSVQCCFSNNCNSSSQGSSSRLSASLVRLLASLLIGFCLFFIS